MLPKKPTLHYPFPEPPASGTMKEIMPGVHWIRMPLPFRLDHINLWALNDGNDWALVDTGMRNEDTVRVWRELLGSAREPKALTRVFVTHMHPDHIGMAGWLTRKLGARLWMTRLEYMVCRVMASDSGREAPPDALAFFREAGWGDDAIETYRARFGNFGNMIHRLPDSYHRISDGMELQINGRTWRVVTGNGHSPEHACLYCPDLKLFISGDQVLPSISSNVSVNPTEPEANPMADWFDSLAKIRREVPADVLVLPAHNECFVGLHERLDYLRTSQEHAHEKLLDSLGDPRRVVDVFQALFGRPITERDGANFGLATGEAMASLNYLLHQGLISRELRDDGVAWYMRC